MNSKTGTIVGMGVLTAIVAILQALAISIRFGMFNITLVLIPIIVGAALYGWWAGAWLGFVFGMIVLFTDAGVFLAINTPGTVITVLAKGILAGVAAGFVFKALSKKENLIGVLCAGIVAPVVNTGIFLLGCRLFFYDTIKEWAVGAGYQNAFPYMIFGLVGVNFVVELVINLVLSTVIVQIIDIALRSMAPKSVEKKEEA
ncbi:MAG: ECF transporter S component [Lachnospiraceae bacterium]|nr:ECF transporter S component [Lachnospiraceae bacterium]